MWLSSWASTPSSSMRFIFSSSPVVTAMAACFGSRPVAKAFGRRVVDDVEPRLRQAAGDAQALDQVVEPGVLAGSAGLGAAHGQRDLVGVPVGDERRADGEHERDDDAEPAELEQRSRTRTPTSTTSSDEADDEERGTTLVLLDLVVQGELLRAQN